MYALFNSLVHGHVAGAVLFVTKNTANSLCRSLITCSGCGPTLSSGSVHVLIRPMSEYAAACGHSDVGCSDVDAAATLCW